MKADDILPTLQLVCSENQFYLDLIKHSDNLIHVFQGSNEIGLIEINEALFRPNPDPLRAADLKALTVILGIIEEMK